LDMTMRRRVELEVMRLVEIPGQANDGVTTIPVTILGKRIMAVFAMGRDPEPQRALFRDESPVSGGLGNQQRADPVKMAVLDKTARTQATRIFGGGKGQDQIALELGA